MGLHWEARDDASTHKYVASTVRLEIKTSSTKIRRDNIIILGRYVYIYLESPREFIAKQSEPPRKPGKVVT